MYGTNSRAYDKAIRGRSRQLSWHGTITLTDGTVVPISHSDIVEGSGTITRSCSSQSAIELGGVYASELQISLRLDIERYKLNDAVINLVSRLDYEHDISTWGDASEFSWGELVVVRWGDEVKRVYTDVPMGLFTVSEALRAVNSTKITAYDDMLKFEKKLPVRPPDTQNIPFTWLSRICAACGVKLGMTLEQVMSLPNGRRKLGFADVNNQITTYRDMLSELAIVLGSVATINRYGELVLLQYGMTPVDTVSSSMRYSSDFSDYQSYYTGLYATHAAEGKQEYVSNSDKDDGLIYDVKANAFMQISNAENRKAVAQAIIDSQKGIKYTPFRVEMPFSPLYDLMDVLQFTDNQTASEDIAPITSITYKISDKMSLQCGGENPMLQDAKSRTTKAVEGASTGGQFAGNGLTGNSFFIEMNANEKWVELSAENGEFSTEDLNVLRLTTTTDITRIQIAWTCVLRVDEKQEYTNVYVNVDNYSIYMVTEEHLEEGIHTMSLTTGYEIEGAGEHEIRIELDTYYDEPEPEPEPTPEEGEDKTNEPANR